MEYVKLGRTGLEVSRICLGCMSYGVPDRGNHAWSIDEAESRPFIQRALEGGINFFDTANRYSLGSSEEILDRAIKDFTRRDEVVIATKVYGRMRRGPNGGGLSRKAIMREIDDSLQRLGTDYVDLYQIHRWDYGTPIEETLEALHDIVKAGEINLGVKAAPQCGICTEAAVPMAPQLQCRISTSLTDVTRAGAAGRRRPDCRSSVRDRQRAGRDGPCERGAAGRNGPADLARLGSSLQRGRDCRAQQPSGAGALAEVERPASAR